MSLSNATANITVKWLPTPDLPRMGSNTDRCNVSDGHLNGNFFGTWNDPLPESDMVCKIGNDSYVYPCCEAVGIEARQACGYTVCRISGANEYGWNLCAATLAAQLGDTRPESSCQPASVINKEREEVEGKEETTTNHAAKQVPVVSLAIVVLLAAAAVV